MPETELPPLPRSELQRVVRFLRHKVVGADLSIPEREKVISALAMLWQSTGFTSPFDWGTWIEEMGGKDWAVNFDTVASADLDTIRRLATTHLRINRFVEGHFDHLVDIGYLTRVYERLKQLELNHES